MIRITMSIILCFLCSAVVADEIFITLKPTKGLVGTMSVNFHGDGKVTLLVVESPTIRTESLLIINAAVINDLKKMAAMTLDEYMLRKEFSQVRTYKLLAGISITRESVTKNISSRKLTQNMIQLITKINNYLPEEHRVKIVAE